MRELVHHTVADGVAVVTVDDPDRRNALTLPLVEQLGAVFDTIEADPAVGAIVVTGAGTAFCAGADLGHLGSGRDDESARTGLLAIYEGFLRVARSPRPTIAAVNGAAVGAGMNLALACDVRVAAAHARFDTRFLDLGLHPGGGHTWMFQRIAGLQATMAAVVFGQVLDGPEAERCGLVWRCVADDELLATATALAARAASAPRELVEKTTATIRSMPDVASHTDAVEVELVPQVWSLGQPAFRERLAALQSRIGRPPAPPAPSPATPSRPGGPAGASAARDDR